MMSSTDDVLGTNQTSVTEVRVPSDEGAFGNLSLQNHNKYDCVGSLLATAKRTYLLNASGYIKQNRKHLFEKENPTPTLLKLSKCNFIAVLLLG